MIPLEIVRSYSEAYLKTPYLDYASQEMLEKRLSELINNISTYTIDGEPRIHHFCAQTEWIWKKIYETKTELERQNSRALSEYFLEENILRCKLPSNKKIKKAATVFIEYPKPIQLVKFGKAQWLSKTIEEGHVLLRPATYYQDTKLSKAQRDDEIKKKRYLDGKQSKLSYFDKITGEEKFFKGILSLEVSSEAMTDYYIYCLTHNFNIRYFNDYDADSCLVIHDYASFSKKMYSAMKAALPTWTPSPMPNPVAYFDPYENKEPDVMVSKDLKYYYQSELRYLCIPPFPRPTFGLKEIDIYLENPKECMELVEIG